MLTVGEILKSERENKKHSLSHIAKKIRVREKFLQAIEDNNWNIFSSKVYISGIIKNYAQFLGIDSERVLAFFRRDYEKREDVSFRKKVSSKHLVPESKRYTTLGLIVLILAFLTYFAYQLRIYFSPPKIQILSPKTFTFKKQDRVRIVGKTEKEAVVMIFKDRIFQNKEGVFIYDFALSPGKNTLVIEVTGANGKKTTVQKEFYLSP